MKNEKQKQNIMKQKSRGLLSNLMNFFQNIWQKNKEKLLENKNVATETFQKVKINERRKLIKTIQKRFRRRTNKMKCSSGDFSRGLVQLFSESNTQKHELIIDKFDVELTEYELKCLRFGEWLNDEVINFWMNMLQERNNRQIALGMKKPLCFFCNTFFYQKLSAEDRQTNYMKNKLLSDYNFNFKDFENSDIVLGYDYNSVRRWTQRRSIDIFSHDLIIIPLHFAKIHWTLGVVDMRNKTIWFFDSLRHNGTFFYKTILRYLKDEHIDKKGVELENVHEWKNGEFTSDNENNDIDDGCQNKTCSKQKKSLLYDKIPQQSNEYDCGVFTCMFAECIGDGRIFDFSQKDIHKLRVKMSLYIRQGSLPV